MNYPTILPATVPQLTTDVIDLRDDVTASSESDPAPIGAPTDPSGTMRIAAVIPAHNEAECIAQTLHSLTQQTRPLDRIIVVADNCSDDTAAIARTFPQVTVLETVNNKHRKSGALNQAWHALVANKGVDVLICLDADTTLDEHACAQWEESMADPGIAGAAGRLTITGNTVVKALQRAEFAQSVDIALYRGFTTVLPGAASALNCEYLRRVAGRDDREGPWTYDSAVEDYELTYRLRELGGRCLVSPKVRAYTHGMETWKALYAQRLKWQTGTIQDLLAIGLNRYTLIDWGRQGLVWAHIGMRLLWICLILTSMAVGEIHFHAAWIAIVGIVVGNRIRNTLRIPQVTTKDKWLGFSMITVEIYDWMRAAWFMCAWTEALLSRCHRQRDLWTVQYSAEAQS